MRLVLIVGATGTVGRAVVSFMPAGVRIRALARNPATADLPSYVEVVHDLTVPDTLDIGLDGVDAVFLVWMAPPSTAAAARKRVTERVQRIVYLSAPHKTAHPFFQQPTSRPASASHVEIERLIEASRMQWTFLRPGMFAANTRFGGLRKFARAISCAGRIRPPRQPPYTSVTLPRSRCGPCVRPATPERNMF
jgi:uncharacterized protein YbjT (DUF2867 family)